MAHLSEIFARTAQALGIAVLTPEYEIVLALIDFPNLTADQLYERSSLSRAGFFNTVERLKDKGLIVSASDAQDRRRRIYRLSEDLREIIFHRFRKYRGDYLDGGDRGRTGRGFVTRELTARRDKGLDYFTCDFQVLFYLHLRPDLPNNILRGLVDASDTKFHTSLRSLLKDGLVSASSEVSDKRIRIYNISCRTRLVMQKLHADIFDWLDGFEPALGLRPSSHIARAPVDAQASVRAPHN